MGLTQACRRGIDFGPSPSRQDCHKISGAKRRAEGCRNSPELPVPVLAVLARRPAAPLPPIRANRAECRALFPWPGPEGVPPPGRHPRSWPRSRRGPSTLFATARPPTPSPLQAQARTTSGRLRRPSLPSRSAGRRARGRLPPRPRSAMRRPRPGATACRRTRTSGSGMARRRCRRLPKPEGKCGCRASDFPSTGSTHSPTHMTVPGDAVTTESVDANVLTLVADAGWSNHCNFSFATRLDAATAQPPILTDTIRRLALRQRRSVPTALPTHIPQTATSAPLSAVRLSRNTFSSQLWVRGTRAVRGVRGACPRTAQSPPTAGCPPRCWRGPLRRVAPAPGVAAPGTLHPESCRRRGGRPS